MEMILIFSSAYNYQDNYKESYCIIIIKIIIEYRGGNSNGVYKKL